MGKVVYPQNEHFGLDHIVKLPLRSPQTEESAVRRLALFSWFYQSLCGGNVPLDLKNLSEEGNLDPLTAAIVVKNRKKKVKP